MQSAWLRWVWTLSPDGPFGMYTADGALLEAMEPLSDWLLWMDHTCNRKKAQFRQRFRLVGVKEPEDKHIRAIRLSPIG